MSEDLNKRKKATQAVWAGEESYLMESVTQVPVVHSVSFGYQDVDEWKQVALGQKKGHIYGRNTNPTVEVFEEKIRQLEGGERLRDHGAPDGRALRGPGRRTHGHRPHVGCADRGRWHLGGYRG